MWWSGRGRKTADQDPGTALPNLYQNPDGSTLAWGPAPVNRVSDGGGVNDGGGGGGCLKPPTPPPGNPTTNQEPPREKKTETCDPKDAGFWRHQHDDDYVMVTHLKALGHNDAPFFVRRYTCGRINIGLRELADKLEAGEPIRSPVGMLVYLVGKLATGAPATLPASESPVVPEHTPSDEAHKDDGTFDKSGDLPVMTSPVDPDAARLWDAVARDIRNQVPRPAFETLILPVRGHSFRAEGGLVLTVPSKYAADMLERRYFQAISKSVERQTGREMLIAFALAEGAADHSPQQSPAPPSADSHSQPTVAGERSQDQPQPSPTPVVVPHDGKNHG